MTSFRVAVFDDADIAQFLNKIQSDELEFVTILPNTYESDVDELKKLTYDAFIVDQKLSDDGHILYDGTTIIQQLRTWMASDEEFNSAPIILWSMDGNIESFKNEHSSHNLVDQVWRKSDFIGSDASILNIELLGLIEGYKHLTSYIANTDLGLDSILSATDGAVELAPEEVRNFLENISNHKEHTLAQFIINGLLRFDGVLIKDATLAARLGVSPNSESWKSFKEDILSIIKYTGVFSQANERFWSVPLELWWVENICEDELIGLSATQRTNILNEKFKYGLQVASQAEKHTENCYWYSCMFSGEPLDPRDGFQLSFPQKRTWQEPIFSSFNSIHSRQHKSKGYELLSEDLARFLAMREEARRGR